MKDIIYFLKQMHVYIGPILYVNLLAMTFIGLLEGVSVLLLISMISISGIVNFDIGNSAYIHLLSFLDLIPPFSVLPIILGIFLLVAIGVNYYNRKIMIRNAIIQNSFLRKIRLETYSALLRSKWSFFIKNRKSDLINIMLTEVTKASSGTKAILSFLSSFISTSFQIVLAFWLSPNITVFILFSGVFIVFLNRHFLKKSHALGNRNFQLGREFLAGMTDQLNGIKDVKSNSLEKSRLTWFQSITDRMEAEQVEYTKIKTSSQFYFKSASSIFIAVLIFIALQIFQAQAGQLMLIIVIFSRLWPRVTGIQSSLEAIATSMPSLRIVKAFQVECEKLAELHQEDYEDIKPFQLQMEMECRNVYFGYKLEEKDALKDVNIVIPAKQMTAFVGKSGAGKSTLIDLLMGLNVPKTGQVLIDGIPLTKDNLLSLRGTLSYVPQDPFLFSTSIRDNLMLVKEQATEEEVWEALAFASAADFVKRLPNGIDTVIGDRGIRLSGGERQRLVLARAILRKPSILVLDEATSALDTVSEAKIQESLERLKGKMTIIVIAHRLSTIRNADQVIVLNEGQVIQQGSFYQLAEEKNKVFSRLLGKQLEVSTIVEKR
ncbi:ABC transporter ATP-binding protein [Psychrobacillus sp. NPDC096426]|uniref:ABC transporter ATP-binding protein n=1 Tax=Psychrobacillus sp. NPDC096426 TaxID=3364491 RepID=UPI00381D9C3B